MTMLRIIAGLVLCGVSVSIAAEPVYQKRESFAATLLASRAALAGKKDANLREEFWSKLEADFPVEWDWILQDAGGNADAFFTASPGEFEAKLMTALEQRAPQARDAQDARPLEAYLRACEARRATRLAGLLKQQKQIVFTKHGNIGGSHYAYTEAQTDAQAERNFKAGGGLYVLELSTAGQARRGTTELRFSTRTLLESPEGVIRDPDVSWDGTRILVAWKKSDLKDDYHLFEMNVADGKMRQLTNEPGVADYEGQYLPDGSIVFSSTRCIQIVDCWWTEVSNLYVCDRDGKYIRRLGYDQVHTNYPTVMSDGRVIYTRWEYNDRGQIYVQSLWQMRPDGSAQMEFYGNNSWFPTTILHARGIPGSGKVIGIASGHHSYQAGKLLLIDPGKGRQENSGAQLVAPVRETKAERIDAYGQSGDLFQYPYPLSDREFLVTYHPIGWLDKKSRRSDPKFKVYWMDIDGKREVLAADASISCNQPVPLSPRKVPPMKPSTVDHRKDTATMFVQDIYAGPGLGGVERGSIEKLRVVALEYRVAGIGSNGNSGPAGGALVSTPVAIDNGTWDVKVVLGEVPVEADGSACFVVPARTPVYLQAIDRNGYVAQTMRSWATLQGGEVASCIGCHEEKSETPPAASRTALALRGGPKKLAPLHGTTGGFSYPKLIQPILDKHCVSCHDDRGKAPPDFAMKAKPAQAVTSSAKAPAFSLLSETTIDPKAKRKWSDSYLALTMRGHPNRIVNWNRAQTAPPMLEPYAGGAAKSGLMSLIDQGHGGARLSRAERDLIACWIDLLVPYCGDYVEANAWSEKEMAKHEKYAQKRQRFDEMARQAAIEWMEKK